MAWKLKWLRRHKATCALPVVIYSELEDPNVKEEARQLGISAFVPKEPECRTLIDALLPLLSLQQNKTN